MRKKSKYKPKPVILDAMSHVKLGVTKITAFTTGLLNLKIKSHGYMLDLVEGRATKDDVIMLMQSVNVAAAIAKNGVGEDHIDEFVESQQALVDIVAYGDAHNGQYVGRPQQLAAISRSLQIHDAQLGHITVADFDDAVKYVNKYVLEAQKKL
jgi:hypothetical protein